MASGKKGYIPEQQLCLRMFGLRTRHGRLCAQSCYLQDLIKDLRRVMISAWKGSIQKRQQKRKRRWLKAFSARGGRMNRVKIEKFSLSRLRVQRRTSVFNAVVKLFKRVSSANWMIPLCLLPWFAHLEKGKAAANSQIFFWKFNTVKHSKCRK